MSRLAVQFIDNLLAIAFSLLTITFLITAVAFFARWIKKVFDSFDLPEHDEENFS